jgi:hypothetical protein
MTYAAHTVTSGPKPFTIYGITANINHFLGVTLTPDEADGASNVTVSSGGGTRQQYPGDSTPVGYGGSTKVVLRDPSARDGGSALPGRPFVLQSVDSVSETGAVVYDEKRQFHLKGNIVDLHAFLTSSAAGPVRLISSRGRKYQIKYDEIGGEAV